MTTLAAAWHRFKDQRPRYVLAAEDVRRELMRVAAEAHVPADVSARAKDPGEFVRKAFRKQYFDEAWEKTTDKAGARAVVERGYQVDLLLEALRTDATLTVIGDPQDFRTRKPGELNYSGVHVQVQAPIRDGDADAYEVEVQLRTKAHDLWSSVVSHRLLYKRGNELPEALQHRLYDLLALVMIFDREVEAVVKELPKLRGFEVEQLSTVAETAYFAARPVDDGDTTISALLLDAISAARPEEPVEQYAQAVSAFAEGHADDLAAVLSDYASTAVDGHPDYILFRQPELVLLWERLERDPDRLLAAWPTSGLPQDLLLRTAEVLALPFEK